MKIAIASGKGGTGKTTLSTNLSTMIAKKFNKNITLVDLDVEEPNSKLFIDAEFQKSSIKSGTAQWLEESGIDSLSGDIVSSMKVTTPKPKDTVVILNDDAVKGSFKVHNGMSMDEVSKLMKIEPTEQEKIGDTVIWKYEGNTQKGEDEDLIVKFNSVVIKFRDGKVINSGTFSCNLPRTQED